MPITTWQYNFLLKFSGLFRLKVAFVNQCKMYGTLRPIKLGVESERSN